MYLQNAIDAREKEHSLIEASDASQFAVARWNSFESKVKNARKKEKLNLLVINHYKNPDTSNYRRARLHFQTLSDLDLLNGKNPSEHPDIIYLTNNSFAILSQSSLINELSQHCILVIHDWDNHHWHNNSLACAHFADFYVPAHNYANMAISRLVPICLQPTVTGTVQWPDEFIVNNAVDATKKQRLGLIHGRFTHYEKFTFRNQLISKFRSSGQSVDETPIDYLSLSHEARWKIWTDYKLHLIPPAGLDLPLRFFDALVTGGIPCIPHFLYPQTVMLNIPSKFFLVFYPNDLEDIDSFVARGLEVFDKRGSSSIFERISYALQHFGSQSALQKILDFVMYYIERDRLPDTKDLD